MSVLLSHQALAIGNSTFTNGSASPARGSPKHGGVHLGLVLIAALDSDFSEPKPLDPSLVCCSGQCLGWRTQCGLCGGKSSDRAKASARGVGEGLWGGVGSRGEGM